MAKRDYTSKAAQNVDNFMKKEKETSPLPYQEPSERNSGKKGRPVAERETKVRKSFAIFPSLYEDVQKIAFVKRISISELIADLMREYVDKNKEALSEYQNLK